VREARSSRASPPPKAAHDPSQGACPIIANGMVDGACGVGGGTAQQDEDCARAGVAKLG
jgi:uncharacterized protein GlcG (DUF336 family)